VLIRLFQGEKVCVINTDVKPEMMIITDGWGFIVVYAVTESGHPVMVVWDVNGRFVRRVELPTLIKCWSAWTSRDAFDFVVWVGREGKVFATEVFYCEIREPIDRVREAVACGYCEAASLVVVMTKDGHLVGLPAPDWL
jgi:hypothetical protein